ncbi:hypothetical protein ACQEU8_11485 [Streptomyces sp. CA-250714]|uniref:hypothetical protein n=1 Tax=Streptomyces sp. CA-250714 TaxID=3240060 RepID=UPI003D92C660
MAVNISLVFVFALVLGLLLKSKSLGFGAAFVATGFGYFLASSGAAGPINQMVAAMAQAVATL